MIRPLTLLAPAAAIASVVGVAWAGPTSRQGKNLERIDAFLSRQMDVFSKSGPRLVQSYAGNPKLRYRADVYDTALAICYFLQREDVKRAKALGDALRHPDFADLARDIDKLTRPIELPPAPPTGEE